MLPVINEVIFLKTPETTEKTVLNTPVANDTIGLIAAKIEAIIFAINAIIGEIIAMIFVITPAINAMIGVIAAIIFATTLMTTVSTDITIGIIVLNASTMADMIAINAGATAETIFMMLSAKTIITGTSASITTDTSGNN